MNVIVCPARPPCEAQTNFSFHVVGNPTMKSMLFPGYATVAATLQYSGTVGVAAATLAAVTVVLDGAAVVSTPTEQRPVLPTIVAKLVAHGAQRNEHRRMQERAASTFVLIAVHG